MILDGDKFLCYEDMEFKIFVIEMFMNLLNFDYFSEVLLVY